MSFSHSDGWHDVIVMTPQRFEEGLEAVLAVRDQRTVLLNLSQMDPDQAQRTADFVSGGVAVSYTHLTLPTICSV